MLLKWRQLWTRVASTLQPGPRPKPSRRLVLEPLEHRLAPAVFTVTNFADDGSVGSLRWAVAQANSHANTVGDPSDTIGFDSALFRLQKSQTITLAQGQLTLSDTTGPTLIQGPSNGHVSIDGNQTSRIFGINAGVRATLDGLGLLHGAATAGTDNRGGGILNKGTLVLDGCTIANNAAGIGGGIENDFRSTLTLNNCTLSGNTAGLGGGFENGVFSTMTLNNCTVSGNTADNAGGGIYNLGTLTLNDSTVGENSALGAGGGGILNREQATLVLNNSLLSGNVATDDVGGGLFDTGGTTTLNDSTVSGNRTATSGGGVYTRGTLILNRCTVSDNRAATDGAGLYNEDGTMTLTASSITSNFVFGSNFFIPHNGGGLYNSGGLTLTDSTVANNSADSHGAGLYNTGTATVSTSTFSGNSAGGSGGGLYTTGTATVSNSTVFNNFATNSGGGMANNGTLTVRNSTIAFNRAFSGEGGGIETTFFPATATLINTLIARNTESNATVDRPDVAGVFSSSGHNLIGILGDFAFGLANGVKGDIIGSRAAPVDPRLGPLQDNGGPTKTLLLLPGSPAINAGDPNFAPGGTDQRGLPRVIGGRLDIGAVEVPVQIQSIVLNDGSAQRSMINQITITFTGLVDLPAVPPSAFQLINQTSGGSVTPTVTSSASDGRTTLVLTFPTLTGGSLTDGRYTLTVLGNALTDTSGGTTLDGDGDNISGGDSLNAFFRLFGDSDGNGAVDYFDYFGFRSSYGKHAGDVGYLWYFDSDTNGAVDAADYSRFLANFHKQI